MTAPQPPTLMALHAAPEWLAAADDSGAPTLPRFRMEAYNGGPMRIAGWRHPVVVDLAGMDIPSQARPIRLQHEAALGIGHTEAIETSAGRLLARGVISRATPQAAEVVAAGRNGFPWQASIGATVIEHEFVAAGATGRANGREFAGPVNIVRRSVLGEISFVDLGADQTTTATIAARAAQEPPMSADLAARRAALCAAHPDHELLILAALVEGADDDAIAAQIAAAAQIALIAERDALRDQLAAAQADLAAARSEHTTALAALTAERDQAAAQVATLAARLATPPIPAAAPAADLPAARRDFSDQQRLHYIAAHGVAAYRALPY